MGIPNATLNITTPMGLSSRHLTIRVEVQNSSYLIRNFYTIGENYSEIIST